MSKGRGGRGRKEGRERKGKRVGVKREGRHGLGDGRPRRWLMSPSENVFKNTLQTKEGYINPVVVACNPRGIHRAPVTGLKVLLV